MDKHNNVVCVLELKDVSEGATVDSETYLAPLVLARRGSLDPTFLGRCLCELVCRVSESSCLEPLPITGSTYVPFEDIEEGPYVIVRP